VTHHILAPKQVLDSALLRPGRFDRRVTVERPDRLGREQILGVHIQRRSLPLADDVSIASIASSTTGFTGADLANLVNEAALLAGRSGKGARGRCMPQSLMLWLSSGRVRVCPCRDIAFASLLQSSCRVPPAVPPEWTLARLSRACGTCIFAVPLKSAGTAATSLRIIHGYNNIPLEI
jgi:SpoVK/Ycf46/Vps4 family AAA+-type ATPase